MGAFVRSVMLAGCARIFCRKKLDFAIFFGF